jgi:hypothetical protein
MLLILSGAMAAARIKDQGSKDNINGDARKIKD